ncbi:hypothetical protein HX137_29240 [Pseudomonas sp. 165]|uniref:Uncharacterized protein n=1 Tax=Pseudomonas juntendi TaxID=2666183 RepID=A0AAJ5S818_9PSED|nr:MULTISPECIES: hypothetical protein [Pseudomonas]MDM1714709.1 hypothetical protein [Pseudomonas sp. 165]WEA23700.1 hypothetical protein PWA60_27250 [Pseudomonas juntendi]
MNRMPIYIVLASALPLIGVIGVPALVISLGGPVAAPPDYTTPVLALVLGCLLAATLEFLNRKAEKNRVMVDVKPNMVTIAGVSTEGAYSTSGHFVASQAQLAEDLHRAIVAALFKPDQKMVLRRTAYVRVWPGSFPITELELDALQAVMAVEFIDPIIEVLEPVASLLQFQQQSTYLGRS